MAGVASMAGMVGMVGMAGLASAVGVTGMASMVGVAGVANMVGVAGTASVVGVTGVAGMAARKARNVLDPPTLILILSLPFYRQAKFHVTEIHNSRVFCKSLGLTFSIRKVILTVKCKRNYFQYLERKPHQSFTLVELTEIWSVGVL